MKRSEALEEIRKILAMNGKDSGMGELEEALLHTVESIGMRPPNRKALSWSEIGIPDDDQIEKPNFTVYKWESEDEEK